ncbi:hypothetical protein N9980_00620 [bacterium]|nr:hypothetical protein [bacterium]
MNFLVRARIFGEGQKTAEIGSGRFTDYGGEKRIVWLEGFDSFGHDKAAEALTIPTPIDVKAGEAYIPNALADIGATAPHSGPSFEWKITGDDDE